MRAEEEATVILHHHDRFPGGNGSSKRGGTIPAAARGIHFADRLDVLLQYDSHVLQQKHGVVQGLNGLSGNILDPELVHAFLQPLPREGFRLDPIPPFLFHGSVHTGPDPEIGPVEAKLRQVAEMFAGVIERKSPFTYRHSRGVARIASFLAGVMGFSRREIIWIEVAGLLHDLGKLSIPDEILEKRAALTEAELSVVRRHAYYTYRILKEAGVPDPIPQWAGFHHERPDGNGYPFQLDGPKLPLGSRIMAVADIFTALCEDRPYRSGMSRTSIERIMRGMIRENMLDERLVWVVFDHYRELESLLDNLAV